MISDELTVSSFIRELASPSPAPGGGGAAAVAVSLASALGSMAAGLTSQNRKYTSFRNETEKLSSEFEILSHSLLECIDRDAEGFLPLAAVYKMNRDSSDREQKLQQAARAACEVPLEMLRLSEKLCLLLERLLPICSLSLLSDVGCAAVLCRAGAECASMNTFVNLKLMRSSPDALSLRNQTEASLAELTLRLDRIRLSVEDSLKGTVA